MQLVDFRDFRGQYINFVSASAFVQAFEASVFFLALLLTAPQRLNRPEGGLCVHAFASSEGVAPI